MTGPFTGDASTVPQDSSSGRLLFDPATGACVGVLRDSSAQDVDAAVRRAADAFHGGWSTSSPRHRSGLLKELAGVIQREREVFAELERSSAGKPLTRALGEVDFAVQSLEWFAAQALRPIGEVHASAHDMRSYSDRVPVGVCVAVCPNNYPLLMAVWKAAAALAYGNTVVIKPAPETPSSVRHLVHVAARVMPEGVLQAVYGGALTGQSLCGHPDVAAVSFTGSTAAGREVARRCADGVKRVSLELGGKNPVIVHRDADLSAAAAAVVEGFTGNTGQMCVAASRLIVDETVRAPFVAELSARVSALVVGPTDDPNTALGPLVSRTALERVVTIVEEAAALGATVILPDGQSDIPHKQAGPCAEGFYVNPVILDGVPQEARAWREEVFGPVLSVVPFSTEREALDLAHDTEYGLSASIWTSDGDRAERFGRSLRAGMVWVNTWGDTEESVSVGGIGQSGYGRELGTHAVEQYTHSRAVWIAHRPLATAEGR